MNKSNGAIGYARLRAWRRLRGLSLGEMLIVVAVFLILAVVMVVSSNTVTVRTRVARVKQEEKTLADALVAFRTENSEYPNQLQKLTYPTAFMSSVPADPFLPDHHNPYTYYLYPNDPNASKRFAIIVSAGPDGDVEYAPFGFSGQGQGGVDGGGGDFSATPQFQSWLDDQIRAMSYDPTNGATSRGDIIYVIKY